MLQIQKHAQQLLKLIIKVTPVTLRSLVAAQQVQGCLCVITQADLTCCRATKQVAAAVAT
jgi:hypothetical protein